MGNVFKSLFGHKSSPAPVYNAEKEKAKAAEKAGNANRKAIEEQTETIKTSALGDTGEVKELKKKTVLGG